MNYKYSFLTFIEYGGALIKDVSLPGLAQECIDLGMKLDKKYINLKHEEIGGSPESAAIRQYIRSYYPKENLSNIDFSKFDLENDEFKDRVLPQLLKYHEVFNQMSEADIDYILSKANIMADYTNDESHGGGFLFMLIDSPGNLKFTSQQLDYLIDNTDVNYDLEYLGHPLIYQYIYADKSQNVGFNEKHILKIIDQTNLTQSNKMAGNCSNVLMCISLNLFENKINNCQGALINKFFPDNLNHLEAEIIFRAVCYKIKQSSFAKDIPQKTDNFFSMLYKHHDNKKFVQEAVTLWAKKANRADILELPQYSALLQKQMLEDNILNSDKLKNKHKV